MRSNLATELSDVTLVCEDGKKMEAQSRLLSLFSPLIRSIVNNSNHLLILPDFPLHAVNEVVNLLKGKAGEEEVVKLTKQQVDLLNCLGVPLPTLDKVVAGKRDVDLLVCELCDKKVVDAEEHIVEHSEEVGELSPSEIASFFHKEGGDVGKVRGGKQVFESRASSSGKSLQRQENSEVVHTPRSRKRERSAASETRGTNVSSKEDIVVPDYVFCKIERNISSSEPPPPKKQRIGRGRRMAKNRNVCYIQAGRRALKKKKMLKIKTEEKPLDEDDFQMTLDVARTLAGRSSTSQLEDNSIVEKAPAIETESEPVEKNVEVATRSTGHMTLRPKIRPVRVQVLKYKKSHNPNKTKRSRRTMNNNRNSKQIDSDVDKIASLPKENEELILRNNLLELENIVEDLNFTPQVVAEEVGEVRESSEIQEIMQEIEKEKEPEIIQEKAKGRETNEIQQYTNEQESEEIVIVSTKDRETEVVENQDQGRFSPLTLPLEVQLKEIDKEIAGLDDLDHSVVELDDHHVVELDNNPLAEADDHLVEEIDLPVEDHSVQDLQNPLVDVDHRVEDLEHPVVDLEDEVSGEVASIQEQLMKDWTDEAEDGEIMLIEHQKEDVEFIQEHQKKDIEVVQEPESEDIEVVQEEMSVDNIEEVLGMSSESVCSELW